MKLDGLDHPKTLDLAARLGISLPQTIGHLELLWAFVAQKTPNGGVGKWPDGSIARSAHWTDDPTVFVTALHESGFLDACNRHRFVIHDWQAHCPRWVKAKIKRMGDSFVRADCRADCSERLADSSQSGSDYRADCSPDCSTDSLRARYQAKPSQAKPSQAKSLGTSACADEREKPNGKTRQPDELWDALIDSCGLAGVAPTKSARGAWNRAVKDLRDVGATPAQISERADAYRRKWPNVSLTPTALARRWSEVAVERVAEPWDGAR